MLRGAWASRCPTAFLPDFQKPAAASGGDHPGLRSSMADAAGSSAPGADPLRSWESRTCRRRPIAHLRPGANLCAQLQPLPFLQRARSRTRRRPSSPSAYGRIRPPPCPRSTSIVLQVLLSGVGRWRNYWLSGLEPPEPRTLRPGGGRLRARLHAWKGCSPRTVLASVESTWLTCYVFECA